MNAPGLISSNLGLWRFARRGLRHHWLLHASVVASVAVATAILTGALLVGDSVRASLQRLVEERLGRIDHFLVSDHFFRETLANELAAEPDFPRSFLRAVPLTVLPGITVETKSTLGMGADQTLTGATHRRRGVQLIACREAFWELNATGARPKRQPTGREVVINARLAKELGAAVGDRLIVRLPTFDQAPAESPFGHRDSAVASLADLTIIEILPVDGLASFQTNPSQTGPLNLFLPLETFWRALGTPGRVNAIAVQSAGNQDIEGSIRNLNTLLRPGLDDFGIHVQRVRGAFRSGEASAAPEAPREVWTYWNISTDRLVWTPSLAASILRGLAEFQPQPVSTYLVNRMELDSRATNGERARDGEDERQSNSERESENNRERENPDPGGFTSQENKIPATDANPQRIIPYSMVSAVDPHPSLGPLRDPSNLPLPALTAEGIALNAWTAEELGAAIGDRVRLTYFEPETTHGDPREASRVLTVECILPLTAPRTPYRGDEPAVFNEPPTWANDPDLTPTVAGVTDRDSIEDWEPPFPFRQDLITRADDAYWDAYRTTPKAFVSSETAARLWSSRYGHVTSFRIPTVGIEISDLEKKLLAILDASRGDFGLTFRPLRAENLKASRGTTPFEFLFLGFSMFLIVSAIALVTLVVSLGLRVRHKTWGLLLALGWSWRRVRALACLELMCTVLIGAAVGVVGGLAYARLMIHGLSTWWRGAMVEPFVRLAVSPGTMLVGGIAGTLAALAMVVRATAGWKHLSPQDMLLLREPITGSAGIDARNRLGWERVRRMALAWSPLFAGGAALLLSAAAWRLAGEAQAGAFFGVGFLALLGGLGFLAGSWRETDQESSAAVPLNPFEIATQAKKSLTPNGWAWRSCARNRSRGLLVAGLVAAATFLILAIGAFRLEPTREGTGGFELLAESDRPLFTDWRTRADSIVVGFTSSQGGDASCRNLFQVARPRMLGVRQSSLPALSESGRFAFAGRPSAAAAETSPWHELFGDSPDETVPVILDRNTALYSLHVPAKVGAVFRLLDGDSNGPAYRIVGLLVNSVLQGNLLMADTRLTRLEPGVAGDRLLLIDTRGREAAAVASRWEDEFSDQGLDARPTKDVLRDLLAIQNTYLSTFQALGGLGLLLGTVGLAAVLARSVLERRRELGLLAAIGFKERRIRGMVIREHALLLTAGIAVGVFAALLTTFPLSFVQATRIPWSTLGSLVVSTLLIGLVATSLAVRVIRTGSLVKSLLEE